MQPRGIPQARRLNRRYQAKTSFEINRLGNFARTCEVDLNFRKSRHGKRIHDAPSRASDPSVFFNAQQHMCGFAMICYENRAGQSRFFCSGYVLIQFSTGYGYNRHYGHLHTVVGRRIEAVEALLALGDFAHSAEVMEFVEQNMKVNGGYEFNDDQDGVWFEGTAQAALAYRQIGNFGKYLEILGYMNAIALSDGSIYAADRDGVTTGFDVSGDNGAWKYDRRVHAGATG